MHAYLIIGNDPIELSGKVSDISKLLASKILNFKLSKIDDVRELTNFCKLSIVDKTSIYIENFNSASIEAMNSFLKLLEEPQNNLSFILSANKIDGILSTIISRCQVVSINNLKVDLVKNDEIEKFMKNDLSQKLNILDKLRKRGDALNFLTDLIHKMHINLHNEKITRRKLSLLKNTVIAYKRIEENANPGIQLTNLIVNS